MRRPLMALLATLFILAIILSGVLAALLSQPAAKPSPTQVVTLADQSPTPLPPTVLMALATVTPPPTDSTFFTPTPFLPPTLAPTPIVIPTITAPPLPTLPPSKTTTLPDGRLQIQIPDLGLTVLYEAKSFAASNLAQFVAAWREAFAYVRDRLGVKNAFPMTFDLRTDGAFDELGLGVRGFTLADKSKIFQLYDGSGDPGDNQYITAHELGHLTMYQKMGVVGANTMLSEGLAMYASDEFLRRDGLVSLHDLATACYVQKCLISLATLSSPKADFNGRLTARLNYDLAGSFVSWLIETYGLDNFEKVYSRGAYTAVYGKTLEGLNQEWINFLAGRVKSLGFDPAPYIAHLDTVTKDYVRLYANASRNSNKLNAAAYSALDTARLAVERHDYTTADAQLQLFEQALA